MPRHSNFKNYLYFDTTARNPLRLKHLLKIAKPYEGEILTNSLCETIVKDLIKYKWFKPLSSIQALQNDLNLAGRYEDSDALSDEEALLLLNAWKPDHAEAGFRGSKKDPHWAARWVTYYRECLVYGLIDYKPPGKGSDQDKFAKPFYITELGNLLIDSIDENSMPDDLAQTSPEEQIIFAQIMAKLQSSNPIRRCSYSISPFPLLLQALIYMNEDPDMKPFLGRNETILILTFRKNDPMALKEAIKKFRSEIPHLASSEYIERYIKNEIGDLKLWSNTSSGNSAQDALWRRFRATGLFLIDKLHSLTLDFSQMELVKYIVKAYLNPVEVSDNETSFVQYMSSIDQTLLSYKQESRFAEFDQLKKIANELDWDEIKNELLGIGEGKKTSEIQPIKDLKRALRYEFMVAVAITKKFKNTKTIAYCKTDASGWPISFASGQIGKNSGADIECFEDKMNFIVEPSVGLGDAYQQDEAMNTYRHLKKFKAAHDKLSKGFFVAPLIKESALDVAKLWEIDEGEPIIRALTSEKLVKCLENNNNLYESFYG